LTLWNLSKPWNQPGCPSSRAEAISAAVKAEVRELVAKVDALDSKFDMLLRCLLDSL